MCLARKPVPPSGKDLGDTLYPCLSRDHKDVSIRTKSDRVITLIIRLPYYQQLPWSLGIDLRLGSRFVQLPRQPDGEFWLFVEDRVDVRIHERQTSNVHGNEGLA